MVGGGVRPVLAGAKGLMTKVLFAIWQGAEPGWGHLCGSGNLG